MAKDKIEMSMFDSALNKYCQLFGILLMFIMPVTIMIFLAIMGFNPKDEAGLTLTVTILWIAMSVNALIFWINASRISNSFIESVEARVQTGFPIDSIEGFPETLSEIKGTAKSSTMVFVSSLISLTFFVVSAFFIPENKTAVKAMISVAFGLILLSAGIMLVLRMPKEPAFVPGGLIGFYIPKIIPTKLDNFISEALRPFLDPATRLKYDEWSALIKQSMNPDYESNMLDELRLERAREKILLLIYLRLRAPTAITDRVFRDELENVIISEQVNTVIQGGATGLSFDVLRKFIVQMQTDANEVFTIIDRLIVELTDNLESFKKKSLYITIGTPSIHKGVQSPIRIMAFILNKDLAYVEKRRRVSFRVRTSNDFFSPSDQRISISLDRAILDNLPDKLSLSEQHGEDIIGTLAEMLQVGDAVWIQLVPKVYGHTIIQATIEEGGAVIFGISRRIKINRDIVFYLKTYGGKLSMLGGLSLPAMQILLPMMGQSAPI